MKAMVNSPTLSGTDCSKEAGVVIVTKAMSVDDQVREVYWKGWYVSMEKGLRGCDVILMSYIEMNR